MHVKTISERKQELWARKIPRQRRQMNPFESSFLLFVQVRNKHNSFWTYLTVEGRQSQWPGSISLCHLLLIISHWPTPCCKSKSSLGSSSRPHAWLYFCESSFNFKLQWKYERSIFFLHAFSLFHEGVVVEFMSRLNWSQLNESQSQLTF